MSPIIQSKAQKQYITTQFPHLAAAADLHLQRLTGGSEGEGVARPPADHDGVLLHLAHARRLKLLRQAELQLRLSEKCACTIL